jgi:hypothetical protein
LEVSGTANAAPPRPLLGCERRRFLGLFLAGVFLVVGEKGGQRFSIVDFFFFVTLPACAATDEAARLLPVRATPCTRRSRMTAEH